MKKIGYNQRDEYHVRRQWRREEIKEREKEEINSPKMPGITKGLLRKTWSKSDTSHKTVESVAPPFSNLIRNGKFDLLRVNRNLG
jgi:hypothetical protein